MAEAHQSVSIPQIHLNLTHINNLTPINNTNNDNNTTHVNGKDQLTDPMSLSTATSVTPSPEQTPLSRLPTPKRTTHINNFTPVNTTTHVNNKDKSETPPSISSASFPTSASLVERIKLPSPPTSDVCWKPADSRKVKKSSSSQASGSPSTDAGLTHPPNLRYTIMAGNNIDKFHLQPNPNGWAGETIPTAKFPGRSPQIWSDLLTKLGLTPGKFPAIVVKDRRSQPDNAELTMLGTTAPRLSYLAYTLVAFSPDGKLKLNTIANLGQAWCPCLSTKNQSFRAALCRGVEFINEKDPNERGNEGGFWRLALRTENIEKEREQQRKKAAALTKKAKGKATRGSKVIIDQDEDKDELESLGLKCSSTTGSEIESEEEPLPTKDCGPISQNNTAVGARKRRRSITASINGETIKKPLKDADCSSTQIVLKRTRLKVTCKDKAPTAKPILAPPSVAYAALPAPLAPDFSSTNISEELVQLYIKKIQLEGYMNAGGGRNKKFLGKHSAQERWEMVTATIEDLELTLRQLPNGKMLFSC